MSAQPPRKKFKQLKITSFLGDWQTIETSQSSSKMDNSSKNLTKCTYSKVDDKVIIEMPSDLDNGHTDEKEESKMNPLQRDATLNDEGSISINNCEHNFITEERPCSIQSSSYCKEQKTSKGYPLDSLARLSHENLCIPSLDSYENHTIFVKLPLPDRGIPEADSTNEDLWDDKHVKMPNSPKSLYHNLTHRTELIERWAVICEALSTKITTVEQLREAVLSYNYRYREKWTFAGIKKLLEKEFCEEEHNFFFETVLPGIIRLALALPSIISKPIPLLLRGETRSLSMSQKQVASLLANAFLCTFPRRNVKGPQSEYATFPDINFNRLFHHQDKKAYGKLKCIIHYFKEITSKDPDGMITFTRQCIHNEDFPPFDSSCKVMPKFHIDSKGLIEEADGLLQADFANKYIGGGVLGLGSVQEEIRFVMYPELIVTRLFTEALYSNEVLIVMGAERFNNTSGYASTFQWDGPHYDVTQRDTGLRRLCQLVCLDATNFSRKPLAQYQSSLIMRELKKAYAAFCSLPGSKGIPSAIATGNWGCGAFKGNPILKGLLQLSAAAEANRDLAYFTFGDEKLVDKLYDIYEFIESSGVTVGEIVRLLCAYGNRENVNGNDISEYIKNSIFSAYNSDTDSEQT